MLRNKGHVAKSSQLNSTERVISYLLAHGGIQVTALVEQFPLKLPICLDEDWEVYGQNNIEGKFSIHASVDGINFYLFAIQNEHGQKCFDTWVASWQSLKSRELRERPIRRVTVPKEIVFTVGRTEYVPGAKQKQLTLPL